MPNPQNAILTNLTKYQWYTHLSRTDGADLGVIKAALRDLRALGGEVGVTTPTNVGILFGPTLLADLTDDIPDDFQPYPGYGLVLLRPVRRDAGRGAGLIRPHSPNPPTRRIHQPQR